MKKIIITFLLFLSFASPTMYGMISISSRKTAVIKKIKAEQEAAEKKEADKLTNNLQLYKATTPINLYKAIITELKNTQNNIIINNLSPSLITQYNDILDKALMSQQETINLLINTYTNETINKASKKEIQQLWEDFWTSIQPMHIKKNVGLGFYEPSYDFENKKLSDIAYILYKKFPKKETHFTYPNTLRKKIFDKTYTPNDLYTEEKQRIESSKKEEETIHKLISQLGDIESMNKVNTLIKSWKNFWLQIQKNKHNIKKGETRPYGFGPPQETYTFVDKDLLVTAEQLNARFLTLTGQSLPPIETLLEKIYKNAINLNQEEDRISTEELQTRNLLSITLGQYTPDKIQKYTDVETVTKAWKFFWKQIQKQDIIETLGMIYNSYEFKSKFLKEIAQNLYGQYDTIDTRTTAHLQEPTELLKIIYTKNKQLTDQDIKIPSANIPKQPKKQPLRKGIK